MGKNPFRPPVSEARRALLRKNAGLSAEGGGPRAKAGAGVEIEMLRSWAGRALPMGSVPVPDPRDMNPEELAALGCPNRPPSRALKMHDWERDSNHAERLAGKRVGPASKTPIHRQPNEQVVHEGHLGTPHRTVCQKRGLCMGGFRRVTAPNVPMRPRSRWPCRCDPRARIR